MEKDNPVLIHSFGVGCFHFQKKTKLIGQNPGRVYLDEIEDYLKQDNLIKEVVFSDFTETQYIGEFVENNFSESSDLSEIEYPYPHFMSGTISIKMTMPFRLQKEYGARFLGSLKSENLEITIVYGGHFPVVYVSTDVIEDDPSAAVSLLWKHMKKNLAEKNGIDFHMLGPSPFHADFFIYETDERKYDVEYEESYGYDIVNFYIQKGRNLQDVKFDCQDRIKQEISTYYSIINTKNNVGTNISNLAILIDKNTNFKRKTFSFWPKNQKLDIYDALIKLEKIQTQIEGAERYYKEELNTIEQKFGFIAINPKITYEIENLKDNKVGPYKNILSTMKDRYSLETTSNSAVKGAIAGVIVGYFLPYSKDIILYIMPIIKRIALSII